jgi:hypothetical protein
MPAAAVETEMADNKSGRDKQAQDADRRQRERAIQDELERMDEPEPPVDTSELAYFETTVETLQFPATGAEVVAAVGDETITATDDTYAVAELVPETDTETYESPSDLRTEIQQPTVASAMKQVLEASAELSNVSMGASQADAYRRTFRELRAVDAVDDDEAIQTISDWIVSQIHEKETLPGSRAVRREAATVCREAGYEIRNDEWLGI